jgi:hypothetical protein
MPIYTAQRHDYKTGSGQRYLLSIKPKASSVHEGLAGQLIAAPDQALVQVEIRALRWTPDPPTYNTYTQSAQMLLSPILAAYNEHYKAKCRLIIQSQAETLPKLSPKAQQLFSTFVLLANIDSLHPLDWERFYQFIHFAHAYHLRLSQDDLFRLLVMAGFREEYARHIADIYDHGRNLLRNRTA